MTEADLSLVIPTLNQQALTRDCLRSLAGCNLRLEIIVLDNDSEDGTGDMIREEFPDAVYHRNHTNRGVTEAWRQGLSLASSPCVCIANNDVIFEPGCLEGLLWPLQELDWVGVTSPETIVQPRDARPFPFFAEPSRISPSTVYDEEAAPEGDLLRVGYAGWAFAFRKADFPENFDPRLVFWYQDHDFLYTLLFKRRGVPPFRWPVPGKVPVIVPGARLHHVYQASHSQVRQDWLKRQIERDRRHFYRKWRGTSGHHYAGDIPWGQTVHARPASWKSVAHREGQPADKPSSPLVSVVIPCYERPDLLAETLRSVASQTHAPIEVIMVDDASAQPLLPAVEDGLRGFAGRWRLVRLSHNSGPGMARRAGAQLAQGAYVQYLDSDDIMQPEKLARQVALLGAHPDLVMTYAPTAVCSAGSSPPRDPQPLGRSYSDFTHILPDLLDRIIWTTSSCLWRREWAGDPNLWRPLYGPEDTVYDFLVGLAGRPIGRTPSDGPLLLKRAHDQGISADIAQDVAYQQEILKGYDHMAAALETSAEGRPLRHRVAKLYAGKVMFFLVHRRYREAQYCIERARAIDPAALPLDAQLASAFNRLSGTMWGFGALRRWRWGVKIVRGWVGRALRSREGWPAN